jgi:hypothetical protein
MTRHFLSAKIDDLCVIVSLQYIPKPITLEAFRAHLPNQAYRLSVVRWIQKPPNASRNQRGIGITLTGAELSEIVSRSQQVPNLKISHGARENGVIRFQII